MQNWSWKGRVVNDGLLPERRGRKREVPKVVYMIANPDTGRLRVGVKSRPYPWVRVFWTRWEAEEELNKIKRTWENLVVCEYKLEGE